MCVTLRFRLATAWHFTLCFFFVVIFWLVFNSFFYLIDIKELVEHFFVRGATMYLFVTFSSNLEPF